MKEIEEWITSYVSPRTKKPLGSHGKNTYIIAVKWFLTRSRLLSLPSNELMKFKKFKAEKKGRYVEEEEFYKVLSYAPTETFELAFLLVFETGIRPHELLSLTVQHVEERSDGVVLVTIPEENPVTPSKRNKMGSRTIIVQDNEEQLMKRVNDVKKAFPSSINTRLFPFKHGMLSVIFSRMKQNQLKESFTTETSFKGRLYDLRHVAITNFYLKGLTDQEVGKLAGWTPSSKMSDVYVHVHINHVITSLRRKGNSREQASI